MIKIILTVFDENYTQTFRIAGKDESEPECDIIINNKLLPNQRRNETMTDKELYDYKKRETMTELRVSSRDTVYCEKVDVEFTNPKCCNMGVLGCQGTADNRADFPVCPHFRGGYFVVKCNYRKSKKPTKIKLIVEDHTLDINKRSWNIEEKPKKPVISDKVIEILTKSASLCWLEARTQQGYGNHEKEYKWIKRQKMFEDLAREFLGDKGDNKVKKPEKSAIVLKLTDKLTDCMRLCGLEAIKYEYGTEQGSYWLGEMKVFQILIDMLQKENGS